MAIGTIPQTPPHPRPAPSVTPAQTRQLNAYQSQIRQLADQLAESAGFICSGSLVQRYMHCGSPGCRCHAHPPQLHGPYWQWSYRPTGGKTVSRQIGERQARLYQQWIANRRRLLALIDEMEDVSRLAADLLLAQPSGTTGPDVVMPTERPRRVTSPLAQAVARIAELIEPAAEAAQEWLESKDDDDRELVAEAAESLLAALDQSPDLAPTMTRLLRLLGTLDQRRQRRTSGRRT
jgi:hypothetical protein